MASIRVLESTQQGGTFAGGIFSLAQRVKFCTAHQSRIGRGWGGGCGAAASGKPAGNYQCAPERISRTRNINLAGNAGKLGKGINMTAAIAEMDRTEAEGAAPETIAVEAAVSPLPAKVLELIQPIGKTGTGEDPRYSDQFTQIKQEIDRLSDANFDLVTKLSREVLISVGKDLRVAGYLIMSTLYCKGVAELPDAITVYRMIMDKLWDGCFPVKESARKQAFAWLNSDRMDTFIQQQNGESASLDDLQHLRTEIDLLNKLARLRMGEEAPQWTRINAWVDSNLGEKLNQKSALEREQNSQAQKLSQTAGSDAPLTESRAEQQIGKIVTFYRERGERAQALALSRAIRWGGLQMPPNEAGVTRIPPLRESALNELAALQASGAGPEQVFALCENLLMEPGAQWNMDLQHIAHKALVALNDTASMHVLEAEIKSLLKRCVGLADLCYAGNMVFANEATKEWLNGLATEAPAEDEEQAGNTADTEIKNITIAASKASTGGNLVAGLEVLKELPGNTGRQRFIRRIEEARLCIKTKQTEMAKSMLEALDREIARSDLSAWEPAIAISVWRLQLKQIALELPKANSTQQQELKTRIQEINASICIADPYEAARINRTTVNKGVNHG
ncbi:MAG: TssA family type VI secretion system protein [Gammaproteobacteria bacterium]|nr:TssA family type VI secretion system protein [Gammaproteobacteria bacterium]